jgi:dTDP-4-amino-4,6-dideoxygalactose transaminase
VISGSPAGVFDADRDTFVELMRAIGTRSARRLTAGRYTERLEDALRARLGVADLVACGSGATGLILALTALDVRAGDEVIVPAYGRAELAGAVVALGCHPVFADVDGWTLAVDPADVADRLTGRTRALMSSCAGSAPPDLPRLRELADRHQVPLVEDADGGLGTLVAGRPAGGWGDAGVFRLDPDSALGMPGAGGALALRDVSRGRAVRRLRDHGRDGADTALRRVVGTGGGFDEVQAAFLLHRLPGLPARLDRRTRIAEYYQQRFTGLADRGVLVPLPSREPRGQHRYTLLVENRDQLVRHLAAAGVSSQPPHPGPLPELPAFAAYRDAHDHGWPRATRAARQALAIPAHDLLTDAQVETVADAVCAFRPRA